MAIELTKPQHDEISRHGEETFPNECCGFMLGKLNGDDRGDWRLATLVMLDNRFLITPEAFMRGEKAARAKGLDIVGFYHSHPNAPARPSQYDLDHAWPVYSYVIVSIQDGAAADMTSWRLKEDRSAFDPEEIRTVE